MIEFVIQRRIWILLGLGCLTVVFGAIASQGVFASSLVDLFLGENPAYEVYQRRIRQFANDEVFVIAYPDPTPLAPQSLKRLQRLVKRIKKIEDIARVESILDAQKISGDADSLMVEKYAYLAQKRPDKASGLLAQLKKDSLYRGLLLSPDGQHSCVIVELKPEPGRPVEDGPKVVEHVVQLFLQAGFDQAKIHRVGLLATVAAVVEQTQFNVTRLFPLVCITLLVVLYLIFNRLWPVYITLGVSLFAVVWTAGFSVLLDRNINILVAMTPSVILIVATSDVIHLCSAYMLELGRGIPKQQAIYKSGHEVGTACLMTSATTFVGFVSMSLVPIPVFRQLGLVLGFGVAVALLLAITLTPIMFSFMRTPKAWGRESSRVQKLLNASLGGLKAQATNRPRWIVGLFALVLIGSILGSTQLTIETEFSRRLDENHQTQADRRYYQKHFAGTNFLDVFVDVEKLDGLLEPAVWNRIETFQQKLENIPEVDKVISVLDLIQTIDQAMNQTQPYQKTPISRALLAQYLMLFEMAGGEDLERMVDFERKSLRLAVRLNNERLRATHQLGQRIREMAVEHFQAGVSVQATGLTYLFGDFIDEIISGQRLGFLFAFFTITLLMMLWMKSVKIGLLSMIPNAIPILALGGALGLFTDQVDSDVFAIAMIAIGIGVDDTIHFMMRLRFESQRTQDAATALQQTFHFSGRAILITTLILAIGFAPFAISDYLSIYMIGTLIPFTLLVAMFADILLVPAMCRLRIIDFSTQKSADTKANHFE